MIDLKEVGERLVQNLKGVIKAIKATEMNASVESYKVTSAEIKKHEYMQQVASRLPQHGFHIYWIEVDHPKVLLGEFDKKPVIDGVKYARDNKSTDDSRCVYVGSCTSIKLGDRLMQHSGYKSPQTYSLQLSRWLQDADLAFTFNYFEVENKAIVQYIEDQLHTDLKPLFGKAGGNNRIKK